MQSVKYLNTILTAIAILLALQLWTSWVGVSSDQPIELVAPAHAAGIPNAGHQRKQMLDQLKEVSSKLDQLKKVSSKLDQLNDQFRSGQARVRIDNNSD
jgi:hypothetical protein